MRVALITTGRMELLGLPGSLQQLFQGHEFIAEQYRPGEPFPGYTHARAAMFPTGQMPSSLHRLIQAAVGALIPEVAGAPAADYAFILEDLELVNQGNASTLCSVVSRTAIHHTNHVMRSNRALGLRVARLLRDRVSYHLAVPMPEAWFFGAPSVLPRTGIPKRRLQSVVLPPGDCEQFHVSVPAYDTDNGSSCTTWVSRGRRRGTHDACPPWIATSSRQEHPKAYLAWLARQPCPGNCTAYSETKQGRRALVNLDWGALLQNPTHATFARAMVFDLANALGSAPAGVPTGGNEATLTSLHAPSSAPVLRNL